MGRKTRISQNIFKNIAIAVVAAQQNTKTRRATTGYIDLVGFLAMIEERSKNRLKKEIFIL